MPTFSANGNNEITVSPQSDKIWIHASGTFGGGNLSWEFKGDDNAWHPLILTSALTANYSEEVPVGSGSIVLRVTLAGATAPTIYYHAR